MPNSYEWLQPGSGKNIEFSGPAGKIEALLDHADGITKGIVLITHPQPLLGGSPMHKIPHTLAQLAKTAGWIALRPYFRGVGKTEGAYDHGIGETDDLLAIISVIRTHTPNIPLILIGFSFGAFVIGKVASVLEKQGKPAQKTILLGLPAGQVEGGRIYDTGNVPEQSLIIHGEEDKQVPLNNILNWAGTYKQPVVVLPGADHFFKHHEKALKKLVADAIQ